MLVNVNQFIITNSLPECTVTYKCKSVTRTDGNPSVLDCDDWLFDGVFNGDPSDGRLSITATLEDYNTDAKPPGSYIVEIEAFID